MCNKQVKNEVSQGVPEPPVLVPVAVVTSRVLPPRCFHGDQMFFSCPSSFSVIQTPLPLPVDKVRTETCVCAPSCVPGVCPRLRFVCALPGCGACACVYRGSVLTHWRSLYTHTHRIEQQSSSQLIEECRNSCQFLLQRYRSLLCGYEGVFFFFFTQSVSESL